MLFDRDGVRRRYYAVVAGLCADLDEVPEQLLTLACPALFACA